MVRKWILCWYLLQIPLMEMAKQEIAIGLVYQNYARSKVYYKAFKETLRNINNGQSMSAVKRLADRYTLVPYDCILPRGQFLPSDVLSCLCDTLLHHKVAFIIFVTASEDYESTTSAGQYFLHLAGQTGIPIVAWNADNSGFTFPKPLPQLRIIQMAPPIEHQIRAMLALLKRYNWYRFGVVCSKIPGSSKFIKIVQDQIKQNVERDFRFEMVYHQEIDDALGEHHIRRKLMTLRRSDARIILLYSTVTKVKPLFNVADDLGLLSEDYLWIGTQSVKGSMTSAIPPVQPGMLTINFHTVSHSMFPPPDDVLPMIIGMAPKLFALGLTKLNPPINTTFQPTSTCDNSSRKWELGGELYEKMRRGFLKGNPNHPKDGQDSFFYTFDQDGQLKDSYLTISNLRYGRNKQGKDNVLYWDQVGEYTNNELKMADIEWPGFRTNPPPGTPDKFHLTVVTLQESPFMTVSDLDPETNKCPGNQGSVCDWGTENTTVLKCCTGYCVDLLNKLAEDIGFTYTLYKVRDEKWGLKGENGWNGLIQDLITHKADMCATALKLNSERARDIDFSMPFLETGIAIIVKIRSGVLSPTAFLEPFEYSTWVMILFVSIQTAAFSIFLFEWVSPRSFNMTTHPPPGHKFSLCRSYWLVWATLFSASVTTDVPRSHVSRVMSLVWAAFGLTFMAVYTANLAAFMITRVQYYNLEGIDDERIREAEFQTPMFRYGTVHGGNTHELMKMNWKDMNNYVEKNKFFVENISQGIEAVRQEKLDALIYDAVVLEHQSGKDPNCELNTVGKWTSMTGYGIGFPKNSPLVKKVNKFMLQYQQKGDLERLQNFWLTGSCVIDTNTQNTSAPLGIENFTSAFIMLTAGSLFSVLCLLLEYFYSKQWRKIVKYLEKRGWCKPGTADMSLSEVAVRFLEWKKRKSMSF
ncbi:unnamed protein product [Bursaphelenchus xylophilus]|uniref:(pine wood nematode) hypothetical protein n=1 Tax=Bursaphelenchus xylophilus TaxID=6326 RepID=A0A1I7RRY5_BURXY|nr:unnamed protein product [Bursaphelenchus xylophilus]CAG9123384.1 unnamed protein product [Bursaphelenchus xylophilus]